MTEESNKAAPAATPGVPNNPAPTLSLPQDKGTGTASFGTSGNASEPTIDTNVQDSMSSSWDSSGAQELDVDPDGDTEVGLAGEGSEVTPKLPESGTDGEAEATTDGNTEPLPDFDHANEEVVAKYDSKYLKDADDGSGDKVINLDAFNEELAANYAEGKLDISANGRQYLKKVFGLPDAAIDTHLAGLKAKADAVDAQVYTAAGGQEAYESAHEWAKGGGYTDAQKAKFNEATKKAQKGDPSDLIEQTELLRSRFTAAGGKVTAQPQGQKPFGIRRSSSPARQAGDGAQTQRPAPKGPATDSSLFANAEEHRVAQEAALKSGDHKQMKAVSDKLRRSMQHKDWQG